jgi:hypothetical protein
VATGCEIRQNSGVNIQELRELQEFRTELLFSASSLHIS